MRPEATPKKEKESGLTAKNEIAEQSNHSNGHVFFFLPTDARMSLVKQSTINCQHLQDCRPSHSSYWVSVLSVVLAQKCPSVPSALPRAVSSPKRGLRAATGPPK